MNKKGITAVIVLMAISQLGIIGFQLYWIHQAYQVKEEQFDRGVQEALNRVAAKLETREAMDVIRGQMRHFEPVISPTETKREAAVPAVAPRPATGANRKPARARANNKGRSTLGADTMFLTRRTGKRVVRASRDTWLQVSRSRDLPARVSAGMHLDTAAMRELVYLTSSLDTIRLHNQVNQNFFRISQDNADALILRIDSLAAPNISNLTIPELASRGHVLKIDSVPNSPTGSGITPASSRKKTNA